MSSWGTGHPEVSGVVPPPLTQAQSGSGILGWAALGLAWLGSHYAPTHGWWAALLFAAAAAALLAASPAEGSAPKVGMRRWEPWFLAALVLWAGWLRFYQLADLPRFAVDYEGDITRSSVMLGDVRYWPYDYFPPVENCWPTVIHYQTAIFTKLFGYGTFQLRSISAFYGVLSVVALYFMARRISAPGPAALASLLYAANALHLVMSRRLYVAIPLTFFVAALFYFLLLGIEKRRWLEFFAAGLAAGLMLHFYHSGRVLIGVLPVFFGLLFLFDRPRFPAPKNWAAFALGLLIALSPLIYLHMKDPNQYWAWFRTMDPNSGASLRDYLRTIFGLVPRYAQIFYLRGDAHIQDSVPEAPLMDPVTGLLFSVGFFVALFTSWRTRSVALLGIFLGGMIPALLGGLFPHPVPRRAIVALPAAYAFLALTLHGLSGALALERRSLLRYAALGAGLWLTVSAGRFGWRHLTSFDQAPVARAYLRSDLYLAGKEIQAHPDARVRFSKGMLNYARQLPIYLPKGKELGSALGIAEIVTMDSEKDQLFLLEPHLALAAPFFKWAYPHAQVTVHGWEGNPPRPEYVYYGEFCGPGADMNLLVSVFVPKEEAAAFNDLVDLAKGVRARALSPDFGALWAGKTLHLGANLMLPEYFRGPLTVSLAWPGFHLRVDGKPAALGKPLDLAPGPRYIEIEGRVPAQAAGRLPLTALQGNADLLAERRLMAIGKPVGLEVGMRPGEFNWKGPTKVFYRSLLPGLRVYDGMGVFQGSVLPYTLTLSGKLRAPVEGEYQFRFPVGEGRVLVDGKPVFHNTHEHGARPLILGVRLQAGKAYAFQSEAHCPNAGEGRRVFSVEVKAPGAAEFSALPFDWLAPY